MKRKPDWLRSTLGKILFSIFFLAGISIILTGQSKKLVWSDEFNYSGHPDPEKWRYEEGFVRHREAQYYTKNRLANAEVSNGNLIIRAVKENPDNLIRKRGVNDAVFKFYTSNSGGNYTSASLNTEDKFEFTYGRVEVRAKLPHGRGVWPAIWMLGNNLGWGKGDSTRVYSEIDIMEFVGHDPGKVHANIHPGFKGGDKGAPIDVDKPWEKFNVYAMDWYPDHIDFFFNDTKYFSYFKKDYPKWPYDIPHYLILNLAIGGEWGAVQGIDESIFPQEFVIDYVRVYKLD